MEAADFYINDKLGKKEFKKLSEYIQSNFGVKMPEHKNFFLQCRLKKRLKALNIHTFKEYVEFLFSKEGKHEMQFMIDVVTTHKTDFFRENDHFIYLRESILPYYQEKGKREVTFWSAGCSTGEEPYTIVMTMMEAAEGGMSFNYKVHASDISPESVSLAKTGVYKQDKAINIPLELKKKYFQRSKDPSSRLVKVKDPLIKKVEYFTKNLLDSQYNMNEKFDIVFCRNTLIYFERDIQEKVLNKLTNQLKDNGFLFIGHSESVIGMDLPVKQLKPTIFQKKR